MVSSLAPQDHVLVHSEPYMGRIICLTCGTRDVTLKMMLSIKDEITEREKDLLGIY